MRKKVIISAIAGILVLGICISWIAGSRDAAENIVPEESAVFEALNEQSVGEKAELAETGKVQSESEKPAAAEPEETDELLESLRQNRVSYPKRIDPVEPIVMWNDERATLHFHWDDNGIQIDEDTVLFAVDCYFAEEKRQQKVFILTEAPDFKYREVFRQDVKIWDEEMDEPEYLEQRMYCPQSVDGGYVYELDGGLYFLDEDFKEASMLCDLRELMGDCYAFSVDIRHRMCDVTADAARLIACTDEGLYEYDLESGSRKLLESAYFAPHEIDEEDCLCGQRGFIFDGPVKVEYAPDEQSYAFLTGSEEADWGDITGIVLRSAEGETLYQKEARTVYDQVYDFKWVESEDTTYLAVFYIEEDESSRVWLMDRVDVNTGEVETFEVPEGMFSGGMTCIVGSFLNADTLFYINYKKSEEAEGRNSYNAFEVYRFSSGERQDYEVTGDVDWNALLLDLYDFGNILVKYPECDAVNIKCNEDTDLSTAEIYELFLNGELTVEQEEEQVTIDDLFWDNDIEYCFMDIDDDGSEELLIRDNAVYYAIKAVDGIPQILLEDWWDYEPEWKDYEPEWMDKRLKEFATWQEAYIDFLNKPSATTWVSGSDTEEYSLIYIDDDDIPELHIFTGGMATGVTIVSFYDGKVRAMNRERGGIKYIEHGGLLYSDWGNTGFYPCNIYMLEKGEFSEIGTGWIGERYDEEHTDIWYEYFWEGKEVTEAEYEACINGIIDTSKCVEPIAVEGNILEILEDWDEKFTQINGFAGK